MPVITDSLTGLDAHEVMNAGSSALPLLKSIPGPCPKPHPSTRSCLIVWPGSSLLAGGAAGLLWNTVNVFQPTA